MDLAREFAKEGRCHVPVCDLAALTETRRRLVSYLKHRLDQNHVDLDDEVYLNRFHEFVRTEQLNDLRVQLHRELGAADDFKQLVHRCVAEYLPPLVGNEIVMQRQANFVISLPKDSTTLLYLHTDAWTGCSPYELILWLPLVKVFDTKSMLFIRSMDKNTKHLRAIRDGLAPKDVGELLKATREDLQPVNLEFGQALLFSSVLLHGAQENLTDETRFILNIRFKSLFSPYGTKTLGETFAPLNFLPTTQLGLNFELEFASNRS